MDIKYKILVYISKNKYRLGTYLFVNGFVVIFISILFLE